MDPVQVSPEWELVAEAQKNKDILTREAVALPIEKFRQIPYRPPPFPSNSAIPGEDIAITERCATVRHGAKIMIRIYRPLASMIGNLLIFNAHGGGIF